MPNRFREPALPNAMFVLYHLLIVLTGAATIIPGPLSSMEQAAEDKYVLVKTLAAIMFLVCGALGLVGRLGRKWIHGAIYAEACGIFFGGVGTLIWVFTAAGLYPNGASLEAIVRFAATAVLSFGVATVLISYTKYQSRMRLSDEGMNRAIAKSTEKLRGDTERRGNA